MLFDILSLLSLLMILLCLKRFVSMFPSLLTCVMRVKENLNIEASIKQSRDRNLIATCMVIPFCLIAVRFRLYCPDFLSGLNESMMIWASLLIFTGYMILRISVLNIFRPYRISSDTFKAADKVSYTFFIILTAALLATGGFLSFINTSEETIRNAMLWISIIIYLVHLFRKLQIFNSSCSVFVAFLYLCALEIIPTGTLVVSALIF